LVDGIKQYDTQHAFTYGNGRRSLGTDNWSGNNWINLNNIVTGGLEYTFAKSAYDINPHLPFFLMEAYYENSVMQTQQMLRAQMYWTVLSGGVGGFFGNCPLILFDAPQSNLWSCDVNGLAWQNQLDTQGAANMVNFSRLFNSRNWSSLQPAQGVLISGLGLGTYGQPDYATAALASDSSSIIAYFPTSSTVTVDTSLLGEAVSGWWYNPSNGNSCALEAAQSTQPSFTPPYDGDWVLIVDQNSSAAPGPISCASPPPPDTTAPTVSIAVTPAGPTVIRRSTATITATATDTVGVTKVTFYVNNSLQCTDTTGPDYSCAWQVPNQPGKTYVIQAYAYDAAGNSGVSNIVSVKSN
jgi:hypothetical protein